MEGALKHRIQLLSSRILQYITNSLEEVKIDAFNLFAGLEIIINNNHLCCFDLDITE